MYRIAKDSKISWQSLQRFAAGEELRAAQINLLAEYFGLELVERKRKR